jgi:hypothetical protein
MGEVTLVMMREYDSQLLESVGVRRRRMREALVWGVRGARRGVDENVGKVFAGMTVAAVVCAGCVGWSFVAEKAGHHGAGPAITSGAR